MKDKNRDSKKKCLRCGLRSGKLSLKCRHCRSPFPLHRTVTVLLAIVCSAAALFSIFVAWTSFKSGG